MSQQPFPTAATPAVSQQNGAYYFTVPWIVWLQQLASQPAPVQPVTLGASPASFVASGAGTLIVAGGTVSAISLRRANATTVLGITSGSIPLANNDAVTITYVSAPTVNFIPG